MTAIQLWKQFVSFYILEEVKSSELIQKLNTEHQLQTVSLSANEGQIKKKKQLLCEIAAFRINSN